MNVSLTPQLEDYVKQKVAAGKYNSVSEVMREALRLLEERDALKEMKLEALRRDLQAGIQELDQGEGTRTARARLAAIEALLRRHWQENGRKTLVIERLIVREGQ